jgi:protein-disulfide isomerase
MGADRLLVCGIVLAGLATGALAADDGLIRYEGRNYGIDHASPRLRTLLYDLDLDYYRQRLVLVDELLYEIYLKTEAERRGITTGALADELLRIEAPTERDIRTFYHDNRSRIGQPYGEMRDRIDQHLRDQRLRAEKAGLLARAKSEGEFLLLMSPPDPPPLEIDTEGFPRKGATAPRFTIVEFGDYQCPHCGKAARVLRRIVERYPDDVQLVYMDFPINRSGISRAVAEGAVCAHRQDRFWAYHDLAYERQSGLDHDSPMELAKALELDEAAFAGCLASRGTKARVVRAEREARRLGLRATPSIFVNGRPLRSRHLERDLHRLIDGASPPEQG